MFRRSFLVLLPLCLLAAPAIAQQTQGAMQMPAGHQMTMAMPDNPLGISQARDGSGTSWLPDASPMLGVMSQRGAWLLMLQGSAFVQFIKTGTDRGDDQVGSINWFMAMAQRPLAGGVLQFRTMFSLEPLTVGRCGYPVLLQSGEFCDGAPLHDRQHPHDLFMEVAADYRRPLGRSVAFELYGGPAGEPALGPTAFPHRLSAMPNPIAPISHHWLDSTHVSFGVVTGGLYGRKWKAEGSVFNGREPDDRRYDFDLAALDSYSGRFWFLPSPAWALQVSAGHLAEAEFRADGPREDVDRVTASATYQRLVGGRVWATTIAWGRNAEGDRATSAVTVEAAVDVTSRDTVFGRAEVTGKSAADLVLPQPDDETFVVTKLQAGYTRWVGQGFGMKTGVGGSAGLAVMPEALRPAYGSRVGGELSVYFAVRSR